LNVVVFLGSAKIAAPPWGGRACLGTGIGKWVVSQLIAQGHNVVYIDPHDVKLPVLEKPHFYYEAGTAPPELEKIATAIAESDGIVVVTGEYNHSIPPALTNMLDHFGSSKYSYKPSAIVSYSSGQFGGVRAAMALRPFLSELGCLPVSRICAFPMAQNDFDDSGNCISKDGGVGVTKSFSGLLSQFEWWAGACKLQKAAVGLPK